MKFLSIVINGFRIPGRVLKIIYYRMTMGRFGTNSHIISPLHICGHKSIYIGNRCIIQYKSWLAAMPLTGHDVRLVIEDGCTIGHFNHIYATKSIILHQNVLTADKVYISDNFHGYEDVNTPILKQPIIQNGTVEIGEGSWLGENVCVLGAHIGKHCVIGANSVVTHDIPDYSVAVGAPARVIKRYDFEINEWKKIDDSKGSENQPGGGKTFMLQLAA